jgi:hypothetical protein
LSAAQVGVEVEVEARTRLASAVAAAMSRATDGVRRAVGIGILFGPIDRAQSGAIAVPDS